MALDRTTEVDERSAARRRSEPDGRSESHAPPGVGGAAHVARLQRTVGNRAVQRLLAQREAAEGSFRVDEETASRITSARSGGRALDAGIQENMSRSMGYDFSGVRVHDDRESDQLSGQLSAKAFTTGQDMFFRSGAYNPASSAGQQLLAHELTHVVQQGTGQVRSSGSGMQVNAPNDSFEQEAHAAARDSGGVSSTGGPTTSAPVQMARPGAEEVQAQPEAEDEEELLQTQSEDEEELIPA